MIKGPGWRCVDLNARGHLRSHGKIGECEHFKLRLNFFLGAEASSGFEINGTVCLSAVSLSRQRYDILDFSYCHLSRVLHVTLANWQRFAFEFHLRSSPSNSEYMDISRPADYFI